MDKKTTYIQIEALLFLGIMYMFTHFMSNANDAKAGSNALYVVR